MQTLCQSADRDRRRPWATLGNTTKTNKVSSIRGCTSHGVNRNAISSYRGDTSGRFRFLASVAPGQHADSNDIDFYGATESLKAEELATSAFKNSMPNSLRLHRPAQVGSMSPTHTS